VRKNKGIYIGSRTSPKGSSRACLCWDTNTYSISCCDGSIQAQGIGSITGIAPAPVNTPLTDATFYQAITDILAEDPNGDYDLVPYGKIQDWDVSQVTDMSDAFDTNYPNFNGDISGWDVSSVSNMNNMFNGASAFNQPIGNWDVSSVTDMNFMFRRATNFNQDIGNWNVSSVSDLSYMFYLTEQFNQDLNSWDVSNVINMSGTFGECVFNGDITDWDVSNVEVMEYMFRGAEPTVVVMQFNQDISNWDVSNVTSMRRMFENAIAFNQDLSIWDVDNVSNCNAFSDDTPQWTLPKPNFTNCTP
jgi:surface protein